MAVKFDLKGLNNDEVIASREKYGPNTFSHQNKNGFVIALTSLAKEPMVILLLAA